jgi:sulfite reductase beta subunit-like hemoprotein
MLAQQSK